jgi:hypothetical protein
MTMGVGQINLGPKEMKERLEADWKLGNEQP